MAWLRVLLGLIAPLVRVITYVLTWKSGASSVKAKINEDVIKKKDKQLEAVVGTSRSRTRIKLQRGKF